MRKYGTKKIFDDVTATIVREMENGNVPWQKPWGDKYARLLSPGAQHNALNRTLYHGSNPFVLSLAQEKNNYPEPRWLTFQQIKKAGGYVKRGEKSTLVSFWTLLTVRNPKANEPNEKPTKTIPFQKYFRVFNSAQFDGVELPDLNLEEIMPLKTKDEAMKIATDYIAREKIELVYQGDQPAYFPRKDMIEMPVQDARVWKNGDAFLSTLMHEMNHSTGHQSRLNRFNQESKLSFGSLHYAGEELVAELGNAYLCSLLGIDNTIKNSASYIKSWLQSFKDEPKMLSRSSSKATKSARFILNG
jgi:antirestriction protein ArdC